jgi:hypothetical protein
MFNIVPLLFVSTFIFANPKSIHYSSQGDYLIDQSGNKTIIQGNPWMVCHQGIGDIEGRLQKQKGATIWLINASRYIEIEKPVCDLK